jgi:hypothetical protein
MTAWRGEAELTSSMGPCIVQRFSAGISIRANSTTSGELGYLIALQSVLSLSASIGLMFPRGMDAGTHGKTC